MAVTAGGALRIVVAVITRPRLWATAIGQLLVLARPGWWRRWPPVPAPDAAFLRFRMQTMYGDPEHAPEPADTVAYLEWCRDARSALG